MRRQEERLREQLQQQTPKQDVLRPESAESAVTELLDETLCFVIEEFRFEGDGVDRFAWLKNVVAPYCGRCIGLETQVQLQMGETGVPLSVMQMNGSPINAWAAQQVLDVATGLNAKVFQSTHQNDFVSTFFGENPATGGLVGSFMEAHTNYGTNIDSDVARKVWRVGIFSSPSLPANREK